jgi:hypothetical protein
VSLQQYATKYRNLLNRRGFHVGSLKLCFLKYQGLIGAC